MSPRDEGRYEPLPPITRLPGYIWRRLPRVAKILIVVLAATGAGALAVALPQIRDSQRRADTQAERREAEERERRLERLRVLVRPRTVRASGPPEQMLALLRHRIAEDARRRTGDRILRTSCEAVSDPAGRPAAPRTRKLSCLAVTSDFPREASTVGGSIGYPYRALADLGSGQLTYCRIFGVPGEGGLTGRQPVTVPKTCGG